MNPIQTGLELTSMSLQSGENRVGQVELIPCPRSRLQGVMELPPEIISVKAQCRLELPQFIGRVKLAASVQTLCSYFRPTSVAT